MLRFHNAAVPNQIEIRVGQFQGSNTQFREGHSTFEPGPAGNTLQIGTFNTMILQTTMDELRLHLGFVEL